MDTYTSTMLILLVCLLGFDLSSAIERRSYNLKIAVQLFENFTETYEKTYQNNEEKQKRFEIFKDNLKEINRLNSISSALRGINEFTDLTTAEFVKRYTGKVKNSRRALKGFDICHLVTNVDIRTNSAPDSLDYRDFDTVTSVKSQSKCSNSWAFASAACIESQYARKHKTQIQISVQQIMDCTKYFNCSNGGCQGGGSSDVVFSDFVRTKSGISLEYKYPYKMEDRVCHDTRSSRFSVKLADCIRFKLSEKKLKEALYIYGPMVVSVDATTWDYYEGGVYNNIDCPDNVVNHEALLIGYGTADNEDYWILKSSWGPLFGEEGYIRIARGENACNINTSETYVAVVV